VLDDLARDFSFDALLHDDLRSAHRRP
jgi:hypothetical protein